MRFKKLSPYFVLLIALGGLGVFYPPLVSAVVALAAVFVSGVVAVTGDYVVQQLRQTGSPD